MYRDYNDNELLYLIKDSSEEAHEILYKKYEPIISIKVKKYVNIAKRIGLEYNDLFQEGLIGLSEAIKSYKDNRETSFSSFANICIERKIISSLERFNSKKNSALNESFSLDAPDDINGKTVIDKLYDLKEDPGMEIVNNESAKDLFDLLNKELSPFEKTVFELKLNGLDYKEIALLLEKSYKSVDGALQRIKIKIKKVINEIKLVD